MADFLFATTCNRPRLAEPGAVQALLRRYYFDLDLTVEIDTDPWTGHDHLQIYGDGWPGVWDLPEPYPVDWEPDFDQDGEEVFERFLREIAPHLAEPLIVQAVGTIKGRFPLSACEWRVGPGVDEMEVTGFHQGQTDQTLGCFVKAYHDLGSRPSNS